MLLQLIASLWKSTQRFKLIERKMTDSLVSTLLRWWTTKMHCLSYPSVSKPTPLRLEPSSAHAAWGNRRKPHSGRSCLFTLGMTCLPRCLKIYLNCVLPSANGASQADKTNPAREVALPLTHVVTKQGFCRSLSFQFDGFWRIGGRSSSHYLVQFSRRVTILIVVSTDKLSNSGSKYSLMKWRFLMCINQRVSQKRLNSFKPPWF